jgi:hypothetical protein
VDQAGAIDGLWLGTTGNNHAFDASPPTSGIWYYTPLTSWGDVMTVGRSTVYSCVPEPSDLRAVRVTGSGRFHLRWRWGADGGACVVLAKLGGFPAGPRDPDAIRVSLTDVEYSRLGYAVLNLPPESSGAWHVTVFGVAMVGREPVYSQGLEPTSRAVLPGPHPEITLTYSIRPARLPGRPWSMIVRTEPPGQPVPATTLVGHTRTIPLSVDDGEVIGHFPASRDGSSFQIRTKRNLNVLRLRLFTDPRSDPKTLLPIRLRHPEPGGTRV